MSTKYLDKTGLQTFWTLVKAWINTNVSDGVSKRLTDLEAWATDTDTALANRVKTSDVSNNYAEITAESAKLFTGQALYNALKLKLDASAYNPTSEVASGNTNPVTSGGVYSALLNKVNSDAVYTKDEANNKFAYRSDITGLFRFYGTLRSWETYPNLKTLLNQIISDAAYGEGTVVNMGGAFVVSAENGLAEIFTAASVGAHPAGSNIVVVTEDSGTTFKYDVLSGLMDLSGYVADDDALSESEITTIVNGTVTN